MVGLGVTELAVLAVLGVILLGGPVLAVVIVLAARRRDREPRD